MRKHIFIKKLGSNTLNEVTSNPVFGGCQCYKDCNCKEEFYQKYGKDPLVHYEVKTPHKVHRFATLEEAKSCINDIFIQQQLNNKKIT